ncbi:MULTISPECIES: carboxymuconolactone decarboxylase family protein [Salinivibrio]|uniref:Alkylhydroperoxidase n=1 Tax=Salinivibrio siamensis TaxID=414286 RepID=A0ABX3K9X6_9GAMM|nr:MULTISPECIES: carboxymuconolactone decarboxylase family protein [Salinivibrio]KKA43608.1 alkylhydroperoxidase [Salinivibrio sp. KP-1]OOE67578.1 alkylhydroperoxidase [Salinivibrio sp. IB868]OOE71795.1 alkylhydroperoxidase [Salinivibrio sp. IB870]OOE72096.1 alkylhydroperoxidase [Salinivibrio sp. ML290]OOE84452.1 alkylhydroperoxidase [Salinivibrio sp. PR6]
MTKKNYQEINQQQLALNKQFKAHSSDTLSAFGQLHRAAMAEGDLDVKTKELIALGIGIAARCDGCIGAHVAAALKHGATKQECVETINVAIVMGGGPSLIYGSQALEAVEQLSEA